MTVAKDSSLTRQSGQQTRSVANNTSSAAISLPAVPVISEQKEEADTGTEQVQLKSVYAGAGSDPPPAFHGNSSGLDNKTWSETPLTQFKIEDSPGLSPAETTTTPFNPIQREQNDQVAQLRRGGRRIRAHREAQEAAANENDEQEQPEEESENTLSSWGSWALDQVSGVVLGSMKKGLGVDPAEIATQLKAAAYANVSVYTKVVYLATYGSYAASEFLKDNYADIVGGEAGALIGETDELNSQLDEASDLWEEGEVTPDMLNDNIRDQVINYIAGSGDG